MSSRTPNPPNADGSANYATQIEFLPTVLNLVGSSIVAVGLLVGGQRVPVVKDGVAAIQKGIGWSFEKVGGKERNWTNQVNATVDDVATLAVMGAMVFIMGRTPLGKPIDDMNHRVSNNIRRISHDMFGIGNAPALA